MADKTTNIDGISSSQSGKEITANAFFDAASRATDFGRRASQTSALTWGFYGTPRWYVNTTPVAKSNGTLTLTGASTRYVAANRSLAVSENTSVFPPDKLALFKAVTDSGAVTDYEDHRDPHHIVRFLYGRCTITMADANQALTYEQAMCESIEATDALTALRDLIVPTVPRSYTIFANTTGGYGVRVKTSGGTGITVADGKRCILECDGTNVVRITADV